MSINNIKTFNNYEVIVDFFGNNTELLARRHI